MSDMITGQLPTQPRIISVQSKAYNFCWITGQLLITGKLPIEPPKQLSKN